MNKNKFRPNQRNRLSEAAKIILPILAVGGALTLLIIAPGVAPGIARLLKLKNSASERRVEKELEKLVARGYVSRNHYRAGDTYALTSRARFVMLTNNAFSSERSLIDPLPSQWDGIWRIVIFDVPEKSRADRTLLRKSLLAYGFAYLQQSVWIYPYPCDDFVQGLKAELGIKNKVVYIQAQYVEGDAKMRRRFALK